MEETLIEVEERWTNGYSTFRDLMSNSTKNILSNQMYKFRYKIVILYSDKRDIFLLLFWEFDAMYEIKS